MSVIERRACAACSSFNLLRRFVSPSTFPFFPSRFSFLSFDSLSSTEISRRVLLGCSLRDARCFCRPSTYSGLAAAHSTGSSIAMPSPLPYIHLVTPLILLLPLLSLFRAPSAPIPEPPGIRPITVRRITPRRGLILTTLILLALTSFLDGILLIVDLLSASSRDGQLYLVHGGLGVESWVTYSVGGVVVWSFAAILAEYRAKWGDGALISLSTLGLVCEVPNLAFLAIGVSHAGELNLQAISD